MYVIKSIITIVAIIMTILLVTEKLSVNNTRAEYIKEGHSWRNVLLISSIVGFISGVITSSIAQNLSTDGSLAGIAIAMSTVSGFVTAQAIMTDIKVLMINRHLLRFMMGFNITSTAILKNSGIEGYMSAFLLTLVMSVIITLFVSGIGASDGRAMMATLPTMSYLFGDYAIGLLMISFIIAAIYLYIEKRKDRKMLYDKYKDENMVEGLSEEAFKKAVAEVSNTDSFGRPMGPFILAPFHVAFVILPILIKAF